MIVRPQVLAAAVCAGLAGANAVRPSVAGAAICTVVLALLLRDRARCAIVATLVVAAAWWGGVRLDAIDHSALASGVGRTAHGRVVVTDSPRRARYDVRAFASVRRFDEVVLDEPALLRLPRGRAPPQGSVLEVFGKLTAPRDAAEGFDERAWLRRHGVHVVLRVYYYRVVGRRGGLGGFADAVRRHLERTAALGLDGERGGIVRGVVLGDDAGLTRELRSQFRASGLYHLLAASGQNVALVGGGVLLAAWLIGLPRSAGHVAALAAIGAYVLAVGAQPSVVRAGIAGALASLAWLAARATDRWHFLLLAAVVLLAWNPYTLLDPGFQLSFAAVAAIFVLVPRFQRFLEGYPLGRSLRLVVAVSAACGLATAPIGWFHFHSVQLLTVPANVLAAPAAVCLLAVALGAAAIEPLSSSAAGLLAWCNGWCAAYLVGVARLIGGLPFAQISSRRTLLFAVAGGLLLAAYASGGAQIRLPARPTSG